MHRHQLGTRKKKLICALFALRNNDGGHLFVGVKDDGSIAGPVDCPPAKLAAFTSDDVHTLISKYASEPFSVEITCDPDSTKPAVVVIAVPGGIRTPVIVRADLHDGTRLLKVGTVYVRTLDSNGTPSSAEIPWQSWPMLIETCFKNREGDAAGFIRRTFGDGTLEKLRATICVPPEPRDQEPSSGGSAPPPSPAPLAVDSSISVRTYLTTQINITEKILHERGGSPFKFGHHATAVIPIPRLTGWTSNKKFLQTAMDANPKLTGWPAWLDSQSFPDERERPVVKSRGWEATFGSAMSEDPAPDERWRIEVDGTLFLLTTYQDDIPDHERKPEPGKVLDFGLVILRIAERLEVARKMTLALGGTPDTKLACAFQFDKLRGRELTSWVERGRYISPGRKSAEDIVVLDTEISADANVQTILETTHALANRLFESFDGFNIGEKITEGLVQRLLERRL